MSILYKGIPAYNLTTLVIYSNFLGQLNSDKKTLTLIVRVLKRLQLY